MSELFVLPRAFRRDKATPAVINGTFKSIERAADAEDDFVALERARMAYEESYALTEGLRVEYEAAKERVRQLIKERAPDV